MREESKLFQRVNALGGVPSDEYERGYYDAIGDALELIERHHEPAVEALRKIAVGDGYYGAQAREYKQIAVAALAIIDGARDRASTGEKVT
jgi:hypothetical protein